MKPYILKPFSVVVDLSQFTEENEIQDQWIQQYLQIFPYEALNNLSTVFMYNCNTNFKKYSKKLHRLSSNKLLKKLCFINSMNEFNEYISPIELRLPKTTRKHGFTLGE